MSQGREFRPGKSSLTQELPVATPAMAPGKMTLTQALDTGVAPVAKTEPKGGGTGKGGGNLAETPIPAGGETVEVAPAKHEEKDGGPGKGKAEQKAAAAPGPGTPKHVTPTFVLTETEGPRSNTSPATTDTDTPTFTGKVVKDGTVWRYQLDTVEGKGRIELVYYTADHYPAPTPNDDRGALSNVNAGNWQAVVQDLKDHRTSVAGNYSSYRRTQLHEHYHWATEWQGEVKKALRVAENEIAKLSSSAADPGAATAELTPKATRIFNAQMRAARAAYNALPDTPGSAPYIAGAGGVDALVARIEAEASRRKW
jgi:hypothetical protein